MYELLSNNNHKYFTRYKNKNLKKYTLNDDHDNDNDNNNDISNIKFNIILNNNFKNIKKKIKIQIQIYDNKNYNYDIQKIKHNKNTNNNYKYLQDYDDEDDNEDYHEEDDNEDYDEEDDDEDYDDEDYDNENYDDEDYDDEDYDNEDYDDEDYDEEDYDEEDYDEEDYHDKDYNKNKIIKELVKMANRYNNDNDEINNDNDDMKNDNDDMKNDNDDMKNDNKKNDNNKNKEKNIKLFKELINNKNDDNHLKYFKNNVDINTQSKIIDELKKVNEFSNIEKPYKIILLESNIPIHFKACAMKKITILDNIDPTVSEYFKLKNWIDSFMHIPFNKYCNLPVSIDDGLDKCNIFMENAMNILNNTVYGLDDAKMQIMQSIGQWIVNPDAIGTALAIKGPMGTGKTTLIQHGISKILNRPFKLIPLGGATDATFLEGHSYTYEGSTYGKIVDILIQSKCSNPIIYFDELDKVSDTARGEEIISILTHLIDSTQNTQFHDKYFSEIDFNLSKALFVFSYNDESKINQILKDRMYKIVTKGYTVSEKEIIAKNYLIPSIISQLNFEKDNIIISDESIIYIINNLTNNEAGVRNLKRCLEIIFTKINLFRLMKPDSKLFNKEKCLKIEFPFTVTDKIIEKLIPKTDLENDNWKRMYL